MELELPEDCPEDLKEKLETLADMKTSVWYMLIDQLNKGECSYLYDDLYGYPYDYELYAKDSLDPQVNILNELLEKVELAFEKLKEEWESLKNCL